MVLYVIAGIGDQTYRVYSAGEYELRYKRFTCMAIIVVLTYVAATRSPNFIDTKSYYNHYFKEQGTWDSFMRHFRGTGKDKSFYMLTAVLKRILGDHVQLYLAVISGFSLVLVFSVFRRYSCNFFISTFLFIASGEYVQWTHNGIRQFMGVAIVFAATDLLLNKRYVLYVIAVLIAATFHASAIVMIPAMFVVTGQVWNKLSVLMMVVVLILAAFPSLMNTVLLGIMENSAYADDVDALMSTGGTNILRVLVYSIPALMALVFRDPLRKINLPRMNLSVNMTIIAMGIYIVSMFTSGIYIGRMPIYFSLHNYLALPWMIERFFERNSAKLVYMLLIFCYMVFYYYQMHVVWANVIIL